MPEPDVLSVFFLAALALGIAPGPDNIFVLTQSALYGRLAGFVVTLGLCTGLLVHTTAVAFGIAAIFSASTIAFTAIKLLGAAYLLYLAWQALKAGTSRFSASTETEPSLSQLYRRGIVMNITNPKVAIFFLAFLPQFADPSAGPLVPQLLGLGCLFILATILVFGLVAWSAGFLGEWLKRSPTAQLVLNRIAALVFVGLALRLAVTQR
ncbi:MAG: LysE family translocator [Silicimonas sp.]|uniref:LysE family translocator n=1 Tax=Marinovum algicola TaxID=42444 RepID=UPI0032EB395A